MDRYKQLIEKLTSTGYLSTPGITKAFRNTPRRDYLPASHKALHCIDAPIPIGHGQTNSQPLTVAFMLELLDPKPGHKVLEIGSGSGWQTAILAKIICPEIRTKKCGNIYAYEIIPELAKFGASNLKATLSPKHSKIVNLYETDYLDGYSKHQPYHRIIAAAGFAENPVNLIKSLKLGGIMVFPTEANDIRKVTRKSKIKYEQEIFPGSLFVPITH